MVLYIFTFCYVLYVMFYRAELSMVLAVDLHCCDTVGLVI